MWRVKKVSGGWVVVDEQGVMGYDSPIHSKKTDADGEARETNEDYRQWNNSGLADAPHMDNF
jgi:hypothetical protein